MYSINAFNFKMNKFTDCLKILLESNGITGQIKCNKNNKIKYDYDIY